MDRRRRKKKAAAAAACSVAARSAFLKFTSSPPRQGMAIAIQQHQDIIAANAAAKAAGVRKHMSPAEVRAARALYFSHLPWTPAVKSASSVLLCVTDVHHAAHDPAAPHRRGGCWAPSAGAWCTCTPSPGVECPMCLTKS